MLGGRVTEYVNPPVRAPPVRNETGETCMSVRKGTAAGAGTLAKVIPANAGIQNNIEYFSCIHFSALNYETAW